jgi:hypothetical protein
MVSALTHFVGGSQQRSAGIAALSALRGRNARGWRSYSPAISKLFYLQLLYVLQDGQNKYEAHEVANIVQIGGWLFDEASSLRDALPLDSIKADSLIRAIDFWLAGAADCKKLGVESARVAEWRSLLSAEAAQQVSAQP